MDGRAAYVPAWARQWALSKFNNKISTEAPERQQNLTNCNFFNPTRPPNSAISKTSGMFPTKGETKRQHDLPLKVRNHWRAKNGSIVPALKGSRKVRKTIWAQNPCPLKVPEEDMKQNGCLSPYFLGVLKEGRRQSGDISLAFWRCQKRARNKRLPESPPSAGPKRGEEKRWLATYSVPSWGAEIGEKTQWCIIPTFLGGYVATLFPPTCGTTRSQGLGSHFVSCPLWGSRASVSYAATSFFSCVGNSLKEGVM